MRKTSAGAVFNLFRFVKLEAYQRCYLPFAARIKTIAALKDDAIMTFL
jgi:hypothetical protein